MNRISLKNRLKRKFQTDENVYLAFLNFGKSIAFKVPKQKSNIIFDIGAALLPFGDTAV